MGGIFKDFKSHFGCHNEKYKIAIVILLVIIALMAFYIGKMSGSTINNGEITNLEIQSEVELGGNELDNNLNTNTEKDMYKYQEGDIVAVMKTTNGVINILLETQKVPATANNFIGLAKQGYYDGIIFHRIIKGFMIQGGDPEGSGRGGKSIYGEKFDDEFHEDLSNTKYTISMANAGPNTNGSQFFINVADNVSLDYDKQPLQSKHAVFGRVVEGFESVDKLEKVKTGAGDRPEKEVKMISVDIKEYKGGSLKDYDFDAEAYIKKMEEEKEARKELLKNKEVENGDIVSVHYTGTLEDGEKFDSSYDRGEPISFEVGAKQMIEGFDAGVKGMKIGDKKTLNLSPDLAYGGENVQIPKSELHQFVLDGAVLEKGEKLITAQGEIEILDSDDTTITIANNHPMAGKTLNFDIELVDIK